MINKRKNLYTLDGWTECHYAGLTRRPARIKVNKKGSFFLMGKESESKYGKDVNDEKYTSFSYKEKGIGVYQMGEYLFLGVRLFGLHTLMMWNIYLGGRGACCDYSHYAPRYEEDYDFPQMIVGNLVEMVPLNRDHVNLLTDDSRERLLSEFNKLVSGADQCIARKFNPEEAAEDQPILDEIRALLS